MPFPHKQVRYRAAVLLAFWLVFWTILYPILSGYIYSKNSVLIPTKVNVYTTPQLKVYVKNKLSTKLLNNLVFTENIAQADVIIEPCSNCSQPTITDIVVPAVEFDSPIFMVNDKTLFFTKLDEATSELLKTLYPEMNHRITAGTTPVFLTELYKVTPQYRILPDINGQNILDTMYSHKPIDKTEAVWPIKLNIKAANQTKMAQKQAHRVAQLLRYNTPATITKVNITGVTAITRGLLKRLHASKDHYWLIEKVVPLVSNADIVHVSNEVSFMPNCKSYSGMRFCSDPKYFDILKKLGVNLVELTGNHNNDFGAKWNEYTIKSIYQPNGIQYFGGGLNTKDASKPAVFELNNLKLAFLGYNVFDVMIKNSTPLAGPNKAGANPFDLEKAIKDIKTLHEQGADAIFVHLQYQECYAYPKQRGARYPLCYKPIPRQRELFRKLIDAGASFVIGTQAHQPQVFERYNNGFIFYGLGNFLFDQIQWPGTREGLILTFYFSNNNKELLNIKITPTWQDNDYSIRIMDPKEAKTLGDFLNRATE